MINRLICIVWVIWLGSNHEVVQAQRDFVHPGITYTKGDLDRMKVMIEVHKEPYYSTFLK